MKQRALKAAFNSRDLARYLSALRTDADKDDYLFLVKSLHGMFSFAKKILNYERWRWGGGGEGRACSPVPVNSSIFPSTVQPFSLFPSYPLSSTRPNLFFLNLPTRFPPPVLTFFSNLPTLFPQPVLISFLKPSYPLSSTRPNLFFPKPSYPLSFTRPNLFFLKPSYPLSSTRPNLFS